MRRLLVLILLVPLVGYADTTLRVTGRGTTFELARYDGYLQAVEKVSGSALLSKKEYNNRQLHNNSLSVYSAGYQKNVKVIEVNIVNGEYQVLMDVTIASSNLQRGILGQSENTQYIDGDIHQDQINTYLESRFEGDQLLRSVLSDFPHNAFVIYQGQAEINIVNGNVAVLTIPYSMTWNPNFLSAFEETIGLLQDKNIEYRYTQSGHPKIAGEICIISTKRKCDRRFLFNDSQRVNIVKQMIGYANQPAVRVVLSDDSNNILDDRCHIAPLQYQERVKFYAYGRNPSIRFFYSDLLNSTVSLQVTNIKNVRKVDMYPVPKGSCKNWY